MDVDGGLEALLVEWRSPSGEALRGALPPLPPASTGGTPQPPAPAARPLPQTPACCWKNCWSCQGVRSPLPQPPAA